MTMTAIVSKSKLQDDTERAKRPVDRRDISACPNPHLLQPGRIPVGVGDGLDAMDIGAKLGSRHDAPLDTSIVRNQSNNHAIFGRSLAQPQGLR
jgi:hypothetical protein